MRHKSKTSTTTENRKCWYPFVYEPKAPQMKNYLFLDYGFSEKAYKITNTGQFIGIPTSKISKFHSYGKYHDENLLYNFGKGFPSGVQSQGEFSFAQGKTKEQVDKLDVSNYYNFRK